MLIKAAVPSNIGQQLLFGCVLNSGLGFKSESHQSKLLGCGLNSGLGSSKRRILFQKTTLCLPTHQL